MTETVVEIVSPKGKKEKKKFHLNNVMLWNRTYFAWMILLFSEGFIILALFQNNKFTSYLNFFLAGMYFFWCLNDNQVQKLYKYVEYFSNLSSYLGYKLTGDEKWLKMKS